MNNFKFGNRSGGNRDSYRRNSGGRDERPEMHDAVCNECGKNCQVPFRPNGSKPVYCSDCFEKQNGGRGDSRSNERSSHKPRFDSRDSGRPSQSQGNVGGIDFSKLNKNVETLNNKLDKIIALLGSDSQKKTNSAVAGPKKNRKSSGGKIEGIAKMVASFKKNDIDSKPKKIKKVINPKPKAKKKKAVSVKQKLNKKKS